MRLSSLLTLAANRAWKPLGDSAISRRTRDDRSRSAIGHLGVHILSSNITAAVLSIVRMATKNFQATIRKRFCLSSELSRLKGFEPIIWAVLGLPAKARRWYLFQCTVVGRLGFEPRTLGLKVRCSDQTELPARGPYFLLSRLGAALSSVDGALRPSATER